MKLHHILAGATALAFIATGATAGSFSQSAAQGTVFGITLAAAANSQAPANIAKGANAIAAFFGQDDVASWVTATGSVANNIGTAGNDSAAFTLTGSVSQDCSFYTGNINTTLDFGQIGINTLDNGGVDDAFDMAGPATANIETNVAGCNTSNEVRITKSNGVNGMVSNYAGAFDGAQFTNKLPYTVTASWTGVAAGAGSATASDQSLVVSTSEGSDVKTQGAWKSGFEMNITVPTPSKSLVSGVYSDTLTVELAAI
jgi:hypothetical protein